MILVLGLFIGAYVLWLVAAPVSVALTIRLVARRTWLPMQDAPSGQRLVACLCISGATAILLLPLIGFVASMAGGKDVGFAIGGVAGLLWLAASVVVPIWLVCTKPDARCDAPGDIEKLVQPPDRRLILLVGGTWALLVLAIGLDFVGIHTSLSLPAVLSLFLYASVWLTAYALRQVDRVSRTASEAGTVAPLPSWLRTTLVLALVWMLCWPFPLFPLGSKIRNCFVTINSSMSSTR